MAVFNYKKREISAKIVYYGPALCGKTTNVQQIHQKLNPRQRGELVSLATDADRTLFFDFLPIELENIGGFKTRFQIYTVPGQVYYNSTRKAVLTGVDGVVFVADSQISMEQENLESFNNLIENLKYYNCDITKIPVVFQYNKRDLNNIMTIETMDRIFNLPEAPRFSGSALSGNGVLQALTACCKMVLQDLKRKSQRTEEAASRGINTPSDRSASTAAGVDHRLSPAQAAGRIQPGPEISTQRPSTITTRSENRPQPLGSENSVPPFALSGTDQRAREHRETGQEPFKPEIIQVGKTRLLDPYTLTVPLRLATDGARRQVVTVELTLSIKDFLRQEQ
ncbi:MAG: GTP-binding protein [Deltaproteobacteria bacterium]|nr:GTP-binding protein [Deltaproteobacteria bacterium]